MTDENEQELVNKLLKGRTMSVYALLLTHDKLGVREIQRALNFSSPSLALHHLTKLVELKLVEKDNHGDYSVVKLVRVGSLSLFVRFGKRLLPRFLFLVTLFTTMLAIYLLFFLSWPPTGPDIMFISLCIIAIVVVMHESRRVWLLSPF
ncbi:MAG: helix-turn-helix domain-containing protein [Candidatus Thorarchaeota archaeon]